MARSVNKVILIGTLGRDPEMRAMPNGDAVCNVSIATDEGYKDKNTGQKVDKTEWHRIVAFRRLAEIMGEYLKKGSKVYIEGKLQTREWEKDGIKRYSTEIVANEMTMLDSRNSSGGGYDQNQQQGQNQNQWVAPAQQQGQQFQPQQTQAAPQQQGYQPAAPTQQAPAPQAAPQYIQQAAPQAPAQAPQRNYAQPQQPAPQAPPQQAAPQPAPANNFDNFDDDIPF